MRSRLLPALLVGLALFGCREPDAPLGNGLLFVDSDPPGARIFVDDDDTGLLTPDTISGLSGVVEVRVERDSAGVTYSYTAAVLVEGGEVTTLNGPLMVRCQQAAASNCSETHTFHNVADLRFSTSVTGALLNSSSTNPGLVWPAAGNDRYNVGGAPVFAGRTEGLVAALNPYDQIYLAGRPGVQTTLAGGVLDLQQSLWITPPLEEQGLLAPRGIEVHERVVASDAVPGVILIELRFRNISAEPLYQILDREVPAAGVTWEDAYIGFSIDPDIGNATDDWVSYDPALDAVYAYDASFSEAGFGSRPSGPGLVGLRVLRAPVGSGVVLNAWEGLRDWTAGSTTQASGYGMLSGTASFQPDYPGSEVGYLPEAPGDMRISATAGPVQLAPGDEVAIVVAVALAAPVPGTFTSGTSLAPGDPADANRTLHAVAAALRERLTAAESLLPLLP
jgi:hypothetical protein